MSRRIRFIPEGGALVEVTCRALHSRLLFRPSPLMNQIIIGTLARAKKRHCPGPGATRIARVAPFGVRPANPRLQPMPREPTLKYRKAPLPPSQTQAVLGRISFET